jgi:hypothetical protein
MGPAHSGCDIHGDPDRLRAVIVPDGPEHRQNTVQVLPCPALPCTTLFCGALFLSLLYNRLRSAAAVLVTSPPFLLHSSQQTVSAQHESEFHHRI